MKKQRIEYLGELYKKIRDDLKNRTLEDVSSEKLLEMFVKTENRLLAEYENIKHIISETVEWEDPFLSLDKTQVNTIYKVD